MLPGGTYIKGFMRSYAEFLGLDGQLYVDEYNSRHVVVDGLDDVARSGVPRVHQDRAIERKVVLLALAGIATVTALVIVAWKFGGGDCADGDAAGRRAAQARRPAASGSSGAGQGTYLEVRRGSATGAVLFQGTLRARRLGVPDRQALLALGASAGRRPARARRQAADAPGTSQRARRRSGEDGTHAVEPPARGHRRHGQRARARRPHRPQRAVPRARGAAARARAGADRDRRRRSGGARGGAARSASTRATRCSRRAGSARRTTTARSSSSRRRSGSGCTSTRSSRRRSKASRARRRSGSGATTPTSRPA